MKAEQIIVGLAMLTLFGWVVYRLSGSRLGPTEADHLDIDHSGEGFEMGDLFVVLTFGYSDDGDRLRLMIIQSWPRESTHAERVADPRVARSGVRPLVRHNDGKMRPVGIDGDVYMFEGNHLRTMRVKMNEHTDTHELTTAQSLDAMWAYLQQFRLPDAPNSSTQ